MALKKEIESRAGFTINYWRISDWKINMAQRIVDITVVPYLSEEARIDGKVSVNEEMRKVKIFDRINRLDDSKSITNYTEYFSPEALEVAMQNGQDIYKVMYNYIKEHVEEFAGAEDI